MLNMILQWLKASPWWFFGNGETDGFRGHNERTEKRQRITKFDKGRIKRRRKWSHVSYVAVSQLKLLMN